MQSSSRTLIPSFWSVFPLLLAMTIFGCGPDPLAGWQIDRDHEPDQAIKTDYEAYIKTLSTAEQRTAQAERYFKDSTGRHAVLIVVGLNGTWWNHLLVYDMSDKRVKVTKYSASHYMS